jgi:hypothetical protein
MRRSNKFGNWQQGDTVILTCSQCHRPLSTVLRVEREDDARTAAIEWQDNMVTIRKGVAHLSSTSIQLGNPKLEFTPQVWLNPEDLADRVRNIDDYSRLNGCCGLDGCDGPNQVCVGCGNEVGTLQSDCWTSTQFIVEPSGVDWHPATTE